MKHQSRDATVVHLSGKNKSAWCARGSAWWLHYAVAMLLAQKELLKIRLNVGFIFCLL